MQLIDQRVIFSGTPDTPTANCCFPSIVRLRDGEYLVSWRVGSQKDSADGKVMLSRSSDEGRTWSSPALLSLGPYASQPCEQHYAPLSVLDDGRILCAMMVVERSDPALPFFHPTTEGLLPTRTIFCESVDAGRTWERYRQMDAAPYHSPMPITGPVLQLADGDLACQFEVNKDYDDPRPWRHAAVWKISRDGGITWPDCVEVAHDPADRLMYWDAHYALGSGGFCVGAFWTFDRIASRDATIHLSFSNDDGRHWSTPHDAKIVGQIAHPILLVDGQLMLIYIERFATRSIRALLSDDMGRSFHSECVIYEQPRSVHGPVPSATTADYLQDMDAWTFGRVDAIAEANRTISLVFYGGNKDATNIWWSRMRV
jgi:hypothetical protein